MSDRDNRTRQGNGKPKQMMISNKPKSIGKSFKKLLVYLKSYRIQIILSLLFSTISVVLGIIGPDQIKRIGELLLEKEIQLSKVASVGIGLIIIYTTSFLFTLIQGFIMSGVTARMSKDFRRRISLKINKLPLKYLDNTTTGDILSRTTNDVDMLSDTLSQSLSSIITCVVTIIGALIMMFIYSWSLTLIILCILPVSMLVIALMFRFSHKYFKMQQDSLGEINGHIEEIYTGHNVIKIYNAEDDVLEEFDRINHNLFSSSVKGNILSGLMHPIMNFFGNLGYVFIVILGGIIAIEDITFLASIIPLATYYKRFNNQISQVASISSTLQTTLAASERIFEFLEEPEQSCEKDKITKLDNIVGDVEFKNVNFGYIPEKQILYDLNLKVKGGQKIAVVGSTGAGKTTLVNLLMRFYEVDSGDITIDGVSIQDIKRENVRNLFGMVLQDTWLFEGTIKENIAYGNKKASDEEIIEVCKHAGLHHLIMSQPKGYDMVLSEKSTFSAGERQLLTIARAMLHNAPMLILDEATSSVDTRTEVLIQKAMDKLMSGRTSFIIAHRLSTIINADKIVVMKDGRIVEVGKHNDLLKQNGVYATLYKAQF